MKPFALSIVDKTQQYSTLTNKRWEDDDTKLHTETIAFLDETDTTVSVTV